MTVLLAKKQPKDQKTKRPKTSQDALIIDLSDKFVLPGLMDVHTHIVRSLSKSFYDGYYQSPHRATIGGVVNSKKTYSLALPP